MMLLAAIAAMFASWVPLFFIPVGTGGWFLMGILSGVITAYLGWGMVGMQALSDNVGLTYYLWWMVALALAVGGTGLLGYSLVLLIWRGAGLHIDVSVTQ